ncbi:MAG: GNAT family N-acetyltransferase [Anaerolineae bacterium]|nr:GNAT family N-acetyltransferase [Anaerolineae bacterium]
MLNSATPYSRPLDNGLILKSIADAQDAERIVAFNGHIFGDGVAAMTRSLIFHHPASKPEYWLFIEDETTGQVVSSLALIPWQWRYEDITLKAGEMAIVGTLEAYRNRGLIRAQVAHFQELLRDDEFDLSQIQGIPYFYRQFGYEYALPLEPQWQIELRNIPDQSEEAKGLYHFRRATLEDVPTLMRLYDEANAPLQISTVRNEAVWHFMLSHTADSELDGEIWLMLDAGDAIVGYWRIALDGFGTGLIVSETSRLKAEQSQWLLGWLNTTAIERDKPYVRFNLPVTNDLLTLAQCFGAYDTHTYAWQIHLVDPTKLLRKLGPVLERRIASSIFSGMSRTFVINLYQKAIEVCFEHGKLSSVQSIRFSGWGDIRIPPLLLAPLLLGYRSREELSHVYPDLGASGEYRHLVDVMFPRLEAFIYTNY